MKFFLTTCLFFLTSILTNAQFINQVELTNLQGIVPVDVTKLPFNQGVDVALVNSLKTSRLGSKFSPVLIGINSLSNIVFSKRIESSNSSLRPVQFLGRRKTTNTNYVLLAKYENGLNIGLPTIVAYDDNGSINSSIVLRGFLESTYFAPLEGKFVDGNAGQNKIVIMGLGYENPNRTGNSILYFLIYDLSTNTLISRKVYFTDQSTSLELPIKLHSSGNFISVSLNSKNVLTNYEKGYFLGFDIQNLSQNFSYEIDSDQIGVSQLMFKIYDGKYHLFGHNSNRSAFFLCDFYNHSFNGSVFFDSNDFLLSDVDTYSQDLCFLIRNTPNPSSHLDEWGYNVVTYEDVSMNPLSNYGYRLKLYNTTSESYGKIDDNLYSVQSLNGMHSFVSERVSTNNTIANSFYLWSNSNSLPQSSCFPIRNFNRVVGALNITQTPVFTFQTGISPFYTIETFSIIDEITLINSYCQDPLNMPMYLQENGLAKRNIGEYANMEKLTNTNWLSGATSITVYNTNGQIIFSQQGKEKINSGLTSLKGVYIVGVFYSNGEYKVYKKLF